MKQKKYLAAMLLAPLLILSACGKAQADEASQAPNFCHSESCTETELNAPTMDSELETDERPEVVDAYQAYTPPSYSSSWGLRQSLYTKAVNYYKSQQGRISNSRYITIVDMGMHSSKKRFYLIDLAKGTVERHNVAHGAGSDPDKNGYATKFSNTQDSHMTSLGFYVTLGTYSGNNGYSMRLRGLESSNSNAERRAVVLHPANYVSDANGKAGMSWGCPAVDPKYSKSIINKVKGGSLLLIED